MELLILMIPAGFLLFIAAIAIFESIEEIHRARRLRDEAYQQLLQAEDEYYETLRRIRQ